MSSKRTKNTTFYTVLIVVKTWHNWRGDNMIKEHRIKKGYTQEELAELINISPRQIQRIEKEEEKTKIETLKKIIKILEIPDKEIIKYLKK